MTSSKQKEVKRGCLRPSPWLLSSEPSVTHWGEEKHQENTVRKNQSDEGMMQGIKGDGDTRQMDLRIHRSELAREESFPGAFYTFDFLCGAEGPIWLLLFQNQHDCSKEIPTVQSEKVWCKEVTWRALRNYGTVFSPTKIWSGCGSSCLLSGQGGKTLKTRGRAEDQ